MAHRDNEPELIPIDAAVGGDGDIGGIAQTITSDDIQAILMSDLPVEDRKAALAELRGDLDARSHADRGGEFEPLLADIDRAIDLLSQDSGETGTRAGMGMARSEREDLRSPDEAITDYDGEPGGTI